MHFIVHTVKRKACSFLDPTTGTKNGRPLALTDLKF